MVIALGPLQQAATGTVVTSGAMGAGGAGAMEAGTADPGDFPGGGGRRDPRAAANALLAAKLAAAMKTAANVLTQRYQDNEDNDKKKCELFPYSERDKKCPKGMTDIKTNAHHAIPDHCWRAGGITQKTINAGMKNAGDSGGLLGKLVQHFGMDGTQALDDLLPGGSYYDARMNKEKGLSICVTGNGKNLQHGAIHKAMDSLEDQLGAKGDPKYTATLKDMEEAAAESISKVTGCDKQNLKDQLRKYHNDLGFNEPEKTLLRADSGGKNTSQWGKDPIFSRGSNSGSDGR
jgi:hypothetical protein